MGILRTNKISGLETPTPVTGSVSFDGSGDYLAVTPIDNSFVNWWQSDFTIEAWIYADSYADWYYNDGSFIFPSMVGHFNHNGPSNYWSFGPVENGLVEFYYWKGSQNHTFVTSDKVIAGEWSHIAMSYSVTNGAKLFINGKGTDYISLSGTPQVDASTVAFNIGQYYNASITGYVSNLRILKGTALYTSNFTPPVHELQPIGDTVLLCCNNPDSAGAEATGKTITVNGNAAASTFSPGLTRDFTFGTQFSGVKKFDTQGYFVPPSGTTEQRGRGRGVFGGGYSMSNTIDYIQIQSTGNAQDFGDLTVARYNTGSCASLTRGLTGGGFSGIYQNTIDYITISTTSNSQDFGDLTVAREAPTGSTSNQIRGLWCGGSTPGQLYNVIDYVNIASVGNAIDFGDNSAAKSQIMSCSSPTRALFAGGYSATTVVNYVTIMSTGNSTNFGNLTVARLAGGGCSSQTRGIFGAGATPSNTNTIDYVTIATTGNAVDFGDLINAVAGNVACSSSIRGVFSSGTLSAGVYLNNIEYITIATTGNAVDFGDRTVSKTGISGLSDSHGGLS